MHTVTLDSVALAEDRAAARGPVPRTRAQGRFSALLAPPGDGGGPVSPAARPRADVTVLELSSARGDDTAGRVRALSARGPVLVICPVDRPGVLLAALGAGAAGAVSTDASPRERDAATEAVARGGYFVSAGLAELVRARLRQPDTGDAPALAPREIETLTLLAQGLTHRQVARRMQLTEQTANTYVKRLRAKLHAANKAELVRKGIALGYLSAAP